MHKMSPQHTTVFRTRDRTESREAHLVLTAAGIPAEAVFRDGWWLLVVDREDLDLSAAELEAYRRENPDRSPSPSPKIPVYGGAWAAVMVYAGVVMLVAVFATQWSFGIDWFSLGRMEAGRVMAGEWWRTITALTLHLDVGHLLGNLAFGAVFGFLAGRVLGGGVAWLAIVVAGALGNLMNAAVQAPTHLSIGASTAVFAALGVVVSHALRPRTSLPEKPLKRWSPLVGGVLLLAFTGVGGERTDIVAHVTGFFGGLLIGWGACRLPNRCLASRVVQGLAGLTAIVLVASAWIVASIAVNEALPKNQPP